MRQRGSDPAGRTLAGASGWYVTFFAAGVISGPAILAILAPSADERGLILWNPAQGVDR
jgi:hypothetical protein